MFGFYYGELVKLGELVKGELVKSVFFSFPLLYTTF